MVIWMVWLSVFIWSIVWPRRLMSRWMSSSAAGSSAVIVSVWPGFILSSWMRVRNMGSGQ